MLTGDSKVLICHQFVFMNFYPRLKQLHLWIRQITSQKSTILNGNYSLMFLVFSMNVRNMMLLIINKIHVNNNPVEH